ncbi:MAG: Ig-like domain-containing protein [Candidatus Brocadiae bacterium]|nr:Ig-like domain-containing protein [Candidatus Brocadiia bacterium]
MRRLLLLTLLATAPLFADEKRKPDTRDAVGVDQVNAYWCPCLKTHWTQLADEKKYCPYCEADAEVCGELVGEYKVVVKCPKGGLKRNADVAMDIEVFQIVVDKDQKPDEVRVMDVSSVKVKLTALDAEGNPVAGVESPVVDAKVSGAEKVATATVKTGKKGEYALGIEILRKDKGGTKIESEVTFSVD